MARVTGSVAIPCGGSVDRRTVPRPRLRLVAQRCGYAGRDCVRRGVPWNPAGGRGILATPSASSASHLRQRSALALLASLVRAPTCWPLVHPPGGPGLV